LIDAAQIGAPKRPSLFDRWGGGQIPRHHHRQGERSRWNGRPGNGTVPGEWTTVRVGRFACAIQDDYPIPASVVWPEL